MKTNCARYCGMAITYYHWAANPVKLRRMTYLQAGHPKPNGFWFDANGEWQRWCEAMQFRLENLCCRQTVTILDESRILFLRNAKDVHAFARKYGRDFSARIQLLQSSEEIGSFAAKYGRDLAREINNQFSSYILWEEVAAEYGGIVIVPYSNARSLKYLWYQGWNCAGGCVWDTRLIRLGKALQSAE